MNTITSTYRMLTRAIFLTLISSVIFLSSCKQEAEKPAEEPTVQEDHPQHENLVQFTEAQYNMAGIELGKIEQRTLSNVLKVNGVLSAPPQNLISVSAPMGGFVKNTDLLQGMRVSKGQVLAVLEHPDYVQLQEDYLNKKSKLQYLEQEFKRQEKLREENVNAAKVYEQTKADYHGMAAQVKGLKEKLAIIGIDADELTEENLSRKINIYSPISGYVSEVNVNIGKYVNPLDVMFEIVDTEHLHAELTVYEKDVVKLRIGQNIRFTLPNQSEKERLASVYLIGRKIDMDRSVHVHAHLEKEDADLLPGMYINAQIELSDNKVNAVPDKAIVMSGGKNYVFVLDSSQEGNHTFQMTEVQKGAAEDGYTEISFLENRNTNDIQLVTKGAFSVLAKMKNTEEEE